MKKRLKKGFTIVEVLVATMILVLFVSMAIVGTSALFGSGEQMMAVSKAAVLGSDVMKAVTNEIRFGEEFSADESGTVHYNSTAYGNNCNFALSGGELVVLQDSGNGEEPKTFRPIGSAAYDEVRIKDISFTVTASAKRKERQIVSCTVSITSDGTNVLWEKTVSVVPLAQKSLG